MMAERLLKVTDAELEALHFLVVNPAKLLVTPSIVDSLRAKIDGLRK